MSQGAFNVKPPDKDKCIHIQKVEDYPNYIPDEQLALKDEILHTQTVLRMMYKKLKEADQARLSKYSDDLYFIACDGLAGQNAQPEVARRALVQFQNEVTTREAGRVKHRHLKRLGQYVGSIGGLCLIVAFSLYVLEKRGDFGEVAKFKIEITRVINFLFLWSGCMTGVWLSFGIRQSTLEFYELHVPEPDLLHPLVRVIFAGSLTLIISLLFQYGVITVGIGNFSTRMIYDDGAIAWLVGALCGISEQLLPRQVNQQASRLLPTEDTSKRGAA